MRDGHRLQHHVKALAVSMLESDADVEPEGVVPSTLDNRVDAVHGLVLRHISPYNGVLPRALSTPCANAGGIGQHCRSRLHSLFHVLRSG
jgi:hypothetical protein